MHKYKLSNAQKSLKSYLVSLFVLSSSSPAKNFSAGKDGATFLQGLAGFMFLLCS